MMDTRLAVVLDRKGFNDVIAAIDAIRDGEKPDLAPVREFVQRLDLFISRDPVALATRDFNTIEVIKKAILKIPVPWFTVPKCRTLNDKHVWDFMRGLRKRSWNIAAQSEERRAALREICADLAKTLPSPARA